MKTGIKLKIVTLACLIGWLGLTEAKAQTVTVVGGYPVIDLTALSPLGCTLTLSEANSRREAMHACAPSNSTLLTVGSAVSRENGTWNAKMSTRYQVMRNDLGTTKNWTDAWNACKAYSGEGGTAGQWRLPTQRELQMIWVLYPQLIGKGSVSSFDAYLYWSSTEYNASIAWYVHFGLGGTYNGYGKTIALRVRCVRDL
ncbi:Lcl C-terminal domain-containing protein [Parabacteroides chinchillae]|uniref:Lcl C-terminal domain-containing protein n=1 Tax=Parabacteroides chinchillae TaxID=871327 RepID=A0A8G2BU36_9BACT|nr:DUF1566 domain-containing protein [Parabacteroides chinchillae]SEF48466.1 Protein of unknown function [Parabacteroides chinchillae]